MANHAPFCVLLHVRQWQQPLAGRLRQELLRRAGALLRATLLGGHIPRARRPRRSSMTALLRPSPPHPHAPHLAPMLPMLPPCTLSSSGVIRHAPYLPGVGSALAGTGGGDETGWRWAATASLAMEIRCPAMHVWLCVRCCLHALLHEHSLLCSYFIHLYMCNSTSDHPNKN